VRFIDFRVAGAAAAALLAACGAPAPVPSRPAVAPAPSTAVPVPHPARNWAEFRHQAALRIVAANPGGTYEGPVPDPLLAIPVLEMELEADGRLRNIKVLRVPTQAKDTTQLAIDAVRRAAPFDGVAHLPRPWKFVEVFLFDDDRKFKPRTLDD
jgi:protein TonB